MTFQMVTFIKQNPNKICTLLLVAKFQSLPPKEISLSYHIPHILDLASHMALLVAQMVKNLRPGFDPWVGKVFWRRAWQPTPVILPGESPWTEEPGGLRSMRLQRVGHD